MRKVQQLALPLGQIDPPEDLLRAAWRASGVPQSFERAMELSHFRTGLKRMAIAMAGKGKWR